jgi:hypothetical protein
MPSEVLEHCTIRSSTPTAMSDLEPKHLHLASSFESGWEGVNLILEQEPRGEMPAATMNFHFVTIALDNLRCSKLGVRVLKSIVHLFYRL